MTIPTQGISLASHADLAGMLFVDRAASAKSAAKSASTAIGGWLDRVDRLAERYVALTLQSKAIVPF